MICLAIPAYEFKRMSTSDILSSIEVAVRVLRERERRGFPVHRATLVYLVKELVELLGG